MSKSSDIYQRIKSKVGSKEELEYKRVYDPKDVYNESLGYLSLRNFKRFIALLYYLIIEKKNEFDLILAGGDSGVSLARITELVYQQLDLKPPLVLSLPIVRWNPKWLHYHGQPTELFDNSILISQIKDKINDLKKLENILLVDDEIKSGYTAKAAFNVVIGAIDKDKISKLINLKIVAEDQGFKPEGFIEGINTGFYYFAKDTDNINNVLSYVIPWSIEKQLKSYFKDEEISSKARVNSLLDLPSKEFERFKDYIIEKPVFTNNKLNAFKKEIPNFPNLQAEFNHLLTKWINEAIEEYKNN